MIHCLMRVGYVQGSGVWSGVAFRRGVSVHRDTNYAYYTLQQRAGPPLHIAPTSHPSHATGAGARHAAAVNDLPVFSFNKGGDYSRSPESKSYVHLLVHSHTHTYTHMRCVHTCLRTKHQRI